MSERDDRRTLFSSPEGGPSGGAESTDPMDQGMWHAPRGWKTRLVSWLILIGMGASLAFLIGYSVWAMVRGV